MNLFALQSFFGGVKADGDVARLGASVNRTSSADAGALVEGAESDSSGFAAFLQVAVEQQPPENKRAEFGFRVVSKAESATVDRVEGGADAESEDGGAQPIRPRGVVVAAGTGDAEAPSLSDAFQTESPTRAPLAREARFPVQLSAQEIATAHPAELIPAQTPRAPVSGRVGPMHSTVAPEETRVVARALADEPAPRPPAKGPNPPSKAQSTQLVQGEVRHSELASGRSAFGEVAAVEKAPATHEPTPVAAAIAPAQTSDGPDPDRDLRRLDPRLRVAVGRVLRRLDQEFGIKAKVAEGYRTAERQKTLFAQGRTLPGKVVTWTLDSAHTKGRAVDLILNDQWTDLEPYRVLQTVAKQEGLHTLGMRDPGHLQLPASSKPMRIAEVEPTPPDPTSAPSEAPKGRRQARSKSGLASTARVAGVAGRAFVARAAAPAVPGLGGLTQGRSLNIDASLLVPSRVAARRATSAASPQVDLAAAKPSVVTGTQAEPTLVQAPAAVPEPRLPGPLPSPVQTESRTALRGADVGLSEPNVSAPAPSFERGTADLAPSGTEGRQGTASNAAAASDAQEPTEVQRETSALRTTAESGSSHRTTPVRTLGAPGTAGRVEQVQALQEAAKARPPGMRVDLGDVDGEGTRVRLDLRGGRVDARIEVNDPALGNNLERKVDSLRAALESRGLEPETLQVRTVAEEPSVSTRLNSLDPSALLDSDPREPRGRSRENSDQSKDLREHRRQDEPKGENENDSEDKRGQK